MRVLPVRHVFVLKTLRLQNYNFFAIFFFCICRSRPGYQRNFCIQYVSVRLPTIRKWNKLFKKRSIAIKPSNSYWQSNTVDKITKTFRTFRIVESGRRRPKDLFWTRLLKRIILHSVYLISCRTPSIIHLVFV